MLYLISYDISDDRKRNRAMEALKDYGRRVQYSAFECDLAAAELAELQERLNWEIDPESDSCRFYRLCGACAEEVKILGKGGKYEKPGHIVV